jgi:hypothetical protein
MVRDALIAAALGTVAVILWPTLSRLMNPPPPPPPAAPVAVVATPEVLPVATLVKDAKLRATPSMYGNVIGKLPRDTEVEMIETKGEWTRVRPTETPPKGAPAEGWAKSALLQEVPPEPETPAKPQKPKKKK